MESHRFLVFWLCQCHIRTNSWNVGTGITTEHTLSTVLSCLVYRNTNRVRPFRDSVQKTLVPLIHSMPIKDFQNQTGHELIKSHFGRQRMESLSAKLNQSFSRLKENHLLIYCTIGFNLTKVEGDGCLRCTYSVHQPLTSLSSFTTMRKKKRVKL